MNPKTRALLWEEVRVSGAIAGVCTAVALLGQLTLRLGDRYNTWHFVSEMMLAITIGTPLLMGVMFTLSTGNSGHLKSGFSRRILRLPVDAWSAVLTVLATRLIEMLLASAILVGTCWLLYGHGPGPRAIFLLGAAYLAIQMLDWLRAVASAATWIVVLFVGVSLMLEARGVSLWFSALNASAGITPLFLLGFVAATAVAYGVSLGLVYWTRSGERIVPLSVPSFGALTTMPAPERRKPFKSPMSAQIWFELRRAGVFLPAVFFVVWVAAIVIFWLATATLKPPPNTHITLKSAWQKGSEVGQIAAAGMHSFQTFWPLEVYPLLALILASVAWGLWFFPRKRRAKHFGRPVTFVTRQPLTKAQQVQARIIVSGIHLGALLFLIGVVSSVSFLYSDHAQILRILYEALTQGEASVREVVQVTIGPVMLAGLIAWSAMYCPLGFLSVLLGFCDLVLIRNSNPSNMDSLLDVACFMAGLFLSWVTVLLPSLWLAMHLSTFARKGLLSLRSALTTVLVWFALAFAFCPSAFVSTQEGGVVPVLAALALSALLVLPYTFSILAQCRRERGEALPRENPAQHRRAPASWSLTRVTATLAAAVLLVAIAWVRWPQEEAWKTSMRSRGLPTDLVELNAWYKDVPADRNAATHYLAELPKVNALQNEWNDYALGVLANVPASPEEAMRLKVEQADTLTTVDDKLLVEGNASVKRGDPIPSDVWEWTKKYSDTVSSKVAPDLHAIAQLGLTESRYPVDLRKGFAVELPHLAQLRNLARKPRLESWVACVERKPEMAVSAFLDMLPIADSLKSEPIFISQLVHVAIIGMACDALENAMSRLVFSDEQLGRMDAGLASQQPKAPGDLLTGCGMIGEQVVGLDATLRWSVWAEFNPQFAGWNGSGPSSLWGSPLGDAMAQISAVFAYGKFERLVVVRYEDKLRDWAIATARAGRIQWKESNDELWKPHMIPRVILASMLLPAFDRFYDSEWRTRTRLDLARTAIAVERYRLAHGQLPQRLDDLVPAYIERVPGDLFNEGRPLSYRIKKNGGFVVYSYGFDKDDDGGKERGKNEGYLAGDLMFTVAPPEIRERPQVAPGA